LGRRAASHEVLLQYWKHDVEAKKDDLRAQKMQDEVVDCTFKPSVLKRHVTPRVLCAHQDMEQQEIRSRGAMVHDELYDSAIISRQQKIDRISHFTCARHSAELDGCTFTPDTERSAASYHLRAGGTAPNYPRGYHETRQRLRMGARCRAETLRMEGQRMARLRPAVSTLHDEDQRLAPSTRSVSCLEEAWAVDVAYPAAVAMSSHHLCGAVPGMSPLPALTEIEDEESDEEAKSAPSAMPRALSAPPGMCAAAKANASAVPQRRLLRKEQRGAAGEGDDAAGIASAARQPRRPLFNIEVRYRADKPPDLLIVHDGDTACEAAADFAAKHALPFEMAQRLRRMLEEHEEPNATPKRWKDELASYK